MACGASTAPSHPTPAGAWGGDHVLMTVSEAGAHLEFDCAHGDIPGAISVDSRGQFAVAGTWVREHGGPVRQDEPADSHPALYSGSETDTHMVLTIQLSDSNTAIGTFTLDRGVSGHVFKCL